VLAAAQAPDILSVNVEDVWQDVQKGWYVPLDAWLERPNPFVKKGEPGSRQWWDLFKYQDISRSKAAPDGKMYCITLDMIETGIFYNKDLFRKLDLRPPKTWDEFMRMQEKIQRTGVTPMLVGTGELADWGVDLVFDNLYRDLRPTMDMKKDPKRDAFQKGYLDWDELAFLHGKGFFTKSDPRWPEVFRILKEWRRFMPKDLGAVDLNREFVQGKGAMLWSSSMLVQRLLRDKQIGFEWGVFYLPPITQTTSRFGSGHDMCIIGEAATQFVVSNTAFSDTGNIESSERLKRCIAFLQYATTSKSCKRIVNEIVALMPNVVGVEARPELAPFVEILKRDYTTTKWVYTFDLRFAEIMNRMLALYLMDGVTHEEFMDWIVSNVATATSTVVRRKRLDISAYEPKWRELASVRAEMRELPTTAR
jgi:raffinose/stachyose/melibiose transport system substrate-binding protein